MSTRTHRTAIAVAALAATVGLIAGCAPQTAASTEPAGASAASTATPARTSTPADNGADARAGGILDVDLGSAFDDAVAQTGATPTPGCEWEAIAEQPDVQLAFQRSTTGDDASSPVNLVAATVPIGNVVEGETVGPVTSEGVGIGSSVDDVLAAYPDAEDVGATGDPRRHLLVETGEETEVGTETLYLSYTEGQPVIWGITATTLDTPLYERCE